MLYYITGTVAVLEENLAVVDCGGVGFACNTTSFTLSRLKVGQTHTLYTHCYIREDAFDIFGFSSREELACFRQLVGVSGVGPKAALSILSALPPDRLSLAIMAGDEKALTMANGVGKKLAQRVILELKDKMGPALETGISGVSVAAQPQSGKLSEAASALSSLGYSQSEIALALKDLPVEQLPLEEIVRQALRAMLKK